MELIPEKHGNDLFICDIADAILKDVMPGMEHPFYSLSKKPDTNIRTYEHNGNTLEIIPSVKGVATIYDKDILIFAISQIMTSIGRGREAFQNVRINAHELLIFTNRGTGGKDYKSINDALIRLGGTMISTNIKTGDEVQTKNFGLIDSSGTKRKDFNGRLQWIEVKLSDWVFNAINAEEVLTLHRDYFRLRKPIERRIYELARKHCGHQTHFIIGLELLHKKSGSKSSLKEFRRSIKLLKENDHLPDYQIEESDNGKIKFINRSKKLSKNNPAKPTLETKTYEEARLYTGAEDVYKWEQDWFTYWIDSGSPTLHNPDKAFIGFCKGRYVKAKQMKAQEKFNF